MRILFYGTPEFAVASLRELIKARFDVVGVVTAPDRPAGRGKKLRASAVKEFALEHNIPIYQPTNMKSADFQEQLRSIHPDLQVVVAFRMMPESVWNYPKHGTMNLHGSLLPAYRGAAPINWAIINGETTTGVSTFLLKHEIDTGDIILKKEVAIEPNMNAGELHDLLMNVGGEVLAKSCKLLESGKIEPIPQKQVSQSDVKNAPKLSKTHCEIDWALPQQSIHNLIRGLSPYPGAYTMLQKQNGETLRLIILEAICNDHNGQSAEIAVEDNQLFIGTGTKRLEIQMVKPEGKRVMNVQDWLRGFDISQWEINRQ